MRSRTAISLFLAFIAHCAAADDSVTVLTADPTPPTLEDLRAIAGDCAITEETKGPIQQIYCKWPDVSVTVRIDSNYNHVPQVTGLQGWFAKVMRQYEPSPERQHAEKLIPNLRQAYICTVTPAFDEGGAAFRFVTHLAAELDGLIFSHRSLYTKRGIHVVGRQADPELLGPVGSLSLAPDGSPLKVTEATLNGEWDVVFMWEEDGTTAILTGNECYSTGGTYESRAGLLYLVDDVAVAQFKYTDSGEWKVDGQALFLKSVKTEVQSAGGVEGFPVEDTRRELLQPDADFERAVVVQHSENVLYMQYAEGSVVWMKRVDETAESKEPVFAEPLLEMTTDELGGDPTAANTETPDPVGEQIRAKSMAAAHSAGFEPATWLPTAGHRAGVPGQRRDAVEIRNRFLALYVLVNWVVATEDEKSSSDLKALVRRLRLKNFMTEQEKKILKTRRKAARQEYGNTIGWKYENMWALAWVLGYDPAPSVKEGQVSGRIILPMIKFADKLSEEPDAATHKTLREEREIKELEDLFYCTHNAVRSAQTGDTSTVPRGFHPVREGGAIHERRHALTWVLSPGIDWDDVDLST